MILKIGLLKYLKNTTWLLLEKIIKIFSSLFIGIWLTRYLGPGDFGLYSYIQSFFMFFVAISSFGLDNILIKEFINNKKKEREIASTSILLKVLGSLILIVVVLINYYLFELSANIDLILILSLSTFFLSFNVVDYFFQSLVKNKEIVIFKVFIVFVSALLKLYCILIGCDLQVFIWLLVVDNAMQSICFFYLGLKYELISFTKFEFSLSRAKSLLNESWPLIFTGILVSAYMRVDQIMIKSILGNHFNGEYAGASRISEAFYFIPVTIVSSLFPAIVNAKKIDKNLYQNRIQKLYDLMVWLAIIIAIPISLNSDWIINLLYGDLYTGSSKVLKIHVWSGVFVFLGTAYSKFLINEGYTKKALYRSILGLTTNIGLNFVLISKYGINGAAIATLLSQLVANYIYDLFDKELHFQFVTKTKSLFPFHIVKKIWFNLSNKK